MRYYDTDQRKSDCSVFRTILWVLIAATAILGFTTFKLLFKSNRENGNKEAQIEYLKHKNEDSEHRIRQAEMQIQILRQRLIDLETSKNQETANKKAKITQLYFEGLKNFNRQNYAGAKDYWLQVQQLDPEHADAKLGLKRVNDILNSQKQ